MTVREAQAGDLAAVVAIERVTPQAPQWGEARYREMVECGDEGPSKRVLLVAEVDGKIAGYAVATMVLDEAELESVAVSSAQRRRGVGVRLCRAVMVWAVQQGAVIARLEVRRGNTAAQGLYERVGFRQTGARRGYYSNPVEDAVLMTVRLQKSGT